MNQFEGIPGLDRPLTPEELEAQKKAVAERGPTVETHDFSADRVVQKEDLVELKNKEGGIATEASKMLNDIMRRFGSDK